MIDLSAEQPIGLESACKIIPPSRNGRRTHLSTVLRWILNGAKAPDGSRVKLEALRLGGKWVTSRQALQRFAEALTPRAEAENEAGEPRQRSAGQRERAAERAGRALEAVGI